MLTLPNSAKTPTFPPQHPTPHRPHLRSLLSGGLGEPGASYLLRATLLTPCTRSSPVFESRLHTGPMASDEVIWGALDRMRLALSEDGEKPAWLPHPTLSAPPPSSPPPPGNSGGNRPCWESGRQALSKGRPRASLLPPPSPQGHRREGVARASAHLFMQVCKESNPNTTTVRRKAVHGFKHSKLC